MDDDWRGLDWEWFRRIARSSAGRARFPFEEFRPYFEATRDRRPRPVHWVVESPPPRSVEERRLATVGTELGLDRRGERRLDAAELMGRFQDERAGLEVARRLVRLGFCRRSCPELGVTDRYYCRAAEDRAELGRQVAQWLRAS